MLGCCWFKKDDVSLRVSYKPDMLAGPCKPREARAGSLTKRNVSVAHPRGDCKRLVRNKAGYLIASHQIPDNGGLAGVIAHDKTASAHFALGIHGKKLNIVDVPCEPPIDGESIVMTAYYCWPLSIEVDGCRGG